MSSCPRSVINYDNRNHFLIATVLSYFYQFNGRCIPHLKQPITGAFLLYSTFSVVCTNTMIIPCAITGGCETQSNSVYNCYKDKARIWWKKCIHRDTRNFKDNPGPKTRATGGGGPGRATAGTYILHNLFI